MPELSPAQKRKLALREQQADAVADGTTSKEVTEPVPLAVMLAEGNDVTIGENTYEIASFPVSKLGKAGKLIGECPEMMVSAALSASDDGEVSAERTADTLNRLMRHADSASEPLATDLMEFALSSMAMSVTESQAAAMTPLVVLALSRKHPNITVGDIEDDLDAEAFLAILCKIFRLNQGLRKRF